MVQQLGHGQRQDVGHILAVQADAEDFFTKSSPPAVGAGDPATVILDLTQSEAALATAVASVPTEIGGLETQPCRL